MAEKVFEGRIEAPRKTHAVWTSQNPTLRYGERITVIMGDGSIRHKTGDGVAAYISLPFDEEDLVAALSRISTAVIYGAVQNLTDEQKARARENIGAAGSVNVPFVTPQKFGAVGDGETDDTAAVRACMEAGKPILLRGRFRITSKIEIDVPVYMVGDGEFLVTCARGFSFSNDVTIDGISFVADSTTTTNLMGVSSSGECNLSNIQITSNYTLDAVESCVMVSVSGVKKVMISNASIHDLYARGNGTIADGPGNITAIYASDCEYVAIDKIQASEIHNVDASGTIIMEDSNCLYFRGLNTRAVVSNCVFTNCGRRSVKTQSYYTIVKGCYFYNDQTDVLGLIGMMDYETEASDFYGIISDCEFDNKSSISGGGYCIANSIPTKISNCHIKSAGYALLLNGNLEFYHCTIKGSALIQSGGACTTFSDCNIDKVTNNGTHTDYVKLQNCTVDSASGKIHATNTKFRSLGILTATGDTSTEPCILESCCLSTNAISYIRFKSRLKNCHVTNDTAARALDIETECDVDGFYNSTGSSQIAIALRAGANATLKNIDLSKTKIYKSSGDPTYVVFPSACDGVPAYAYGFDGAKIFNTQNNKYYEFVSGSGWTVQNYEFTDADKELITNSVIASLPIYDGEVE